MLTMDGTIDYMQMGEDDSAAIMPYGPGSPVPVLKKDTFVDFLTSDKFIISAGIVAVLILLPIYAKKFK